MDSFVMILFILCLFGMLLFDTITAPDKGVVSHKTWYKLSRIKSIILLLS